MSDQYPPHGNNPQGQPPYGNNPPGQPPYGNPQGPYGPPQGQPPYGNPQGPYGPPQGQPPYGGNQGRPGYPQQGYGGPQGPGGPGGPGGPWGPGPGGPGGPQGPGGPGGNKRGLLIGGAVLAVLLVVGGIAGAVALSGGDDDSDSASGGTSETADPSVTASRVEPPTESTPTEETETADPAPTGSGEPFTAEYNFDVEQVCTGGAMTNAAAYDPAKPRIMGFYNKPSDAESWIGDSSGYGQPWQVEYDDYEEVSVVACMKVAEEGKGIACQSENSKGKKIDYTYVPVDYTLTFVEARTGEVLGEGDALPADDADCPFIAFIEDGKAYSSPDDDQVTEAVNAFEFS